MGNVDYYFRDNGFYMPDNLCYCEVEIMDYYLQHDDKSFLCRTIYNDFKRFDYWSDLKGSKKDRVKFSFLIGSFMRFLIWILSGQKTKLIKVI